MAWKAIARFCAGTKHKNRAIGCQDYADYKLIGNDRIIIGAVSDGAGSAKYAEEAAKLVVQTVISSIEDSLTKNQIDISNKQIIENHSRDKVVDDSCESSLTRLLNQFCFNCWSNVFLEIWKSLLKSNSYIFKKDEETKEIFNLALDKARDCLKYEANNKRCSINDFACTLLAFIATPNWMAAMQIGDGFIVIRRQDEKEYKLLFKPQKEEFFNVVTAFVTSDNVKEKMEMSFIPEKHKFICASTDGLELASIHFGDLQPYKPFFQPFDEYMEASKDPNEEDEIDKFLESPQVNSSSDDDKTLLLCFYDE